MFDIWNYPAPFIYFALTITTLGVTTTFAHFGLQALDRYHPDFSQSEFAKRSRMFYACRVVIIGIITIAGQILVVTKILTGSSTFDMSLVVLLTPQPLVYISSIWTFVRHALRI